MKKCIVLLLVVLCAIPGFLPQNNAIVRLHIRANSDRDADQAKKLAVRDEVNALLADGLVACRTKEEALAFLESKQVQLKETAERISGQSAAVTLAEEDFPTRVYGETVYPAGRYSALVITLGAGEGHNWWCVVFPPMCYGKSSSGKTEYHSLFQILWERLTGR